MLHLASPGGPGAPGPPPDAHRGLPQQVTHIAVPLGLGLAMRPEAGALAATRRWDTRGTWLASVNRRLPVEGFRLTATDTDWSRGQGPEVAGPVGALLLLLTGRAAGVSQLSGEGADALRSAVATSA